MTNQANQTTGRPSLRPADQTVQDVLRGALDLLIYDGWCQGAWRDGDRRCLIAAVSDASGRANGEPLTAVADTAVRFLQDERPSLIDFNDDPTTTVDDVISLLDCILRRVDMIADLMRQGVSSAKEVVIERAIHLLETEGWCQHRNTDGTKRCIQLAIAHGAQQVGQYPLGYYQAFDAVERLLSDIRSQPPGNKLSAYNDLATTTYEDIIVLLKEAT